MQLETTLECLKRKASFPIISEIQSFYFSPNKGHIKEIIKARNDEHAHGATLIENAYKPLYENIVYKLDKILENANFLSEFPLIVVTQIDILEGGFEYEVVKIMGDNIIFPKDTLHFQDLRLSRNILYLLDKEQQQILPLAPFLIFEVCPYCHIQETFFLEITNDKLSTYHTYRANHRLKTEKYLRNFGKAT